MDVRDNINAGKYRQQGEYPTKPKEPPVLRKAARDLGDDEAKSLKEVRDDFEQAKTDWRDAVTAWRKRDNDLVEQFWDDVAEENGWLRDDKFVQKMEGLAWEDGHANGLSEVLCSLEDLVLLYELYKAK